MKKMFYMLLTGLMTSAFVAHADEKAPATSKDDGHVSTSTMNQDSGSRLMKINQDDANDNERRQALMEQLRKLYKANFL